MINHLFKYLLMTVLMIVMIFFNLFGPYYLTFLFPNNNKMSLGIQYWYLGADIYRDLQSINETGFKTIKIHLDCDTINYFGGPNNDTDLFYRIVKEYYNFKITVIVWYDDLDKLDYYLERWGKYVTYIQVLNEPDVSSAWTLPGAVYIDEEIYTLTETIVQKVRAYNSSIGLYTNLTPGILLRSNLPGFFSNITDFLGLDIYMDSGLRFSPFIYSSMKKLSNNKEIIISEFGICDNDDTRQADYIIEGLNFFKNYGIKECWLMCWGGQGSWVGEGYNIGGRLAQQRIKEWIQQNGS